MKFSSKIKLHPLTFVVLFAGFITGYVRYIAMIFSIVIIHEFGHICFAHLFKRKVESINILPFGGLTKMSSLVSENIFEDLLISVGGIFFQTILGLILLLLNDRSLIDRNTFEFLNMYNMFIIAFNIVPICPLDGYKIIKLLSELFIPFKISFIISSTISFILLSILAIIFPDIFKDNIFIFIFLIFMTLEETKNCSFIMNRFYIERMNHDFDYSPKKITRKEKMFKNRVNYIGKIHEKKFLKDFFMGKSY